ncbi:endonuclease MutS2 [Helicobacter himalayensis]|uniref:endonuclease MutS2 n=1 Tax=Helicobacter himalayensis TaxID=1591088 RepID=UPI00083656B0|nr:endonuclease MutS2 [Helicobacter himalayensis]
MQLLAELDLEDFIARFSTFFARQKNFTFEGDRETFSCFLQELESLQLKSPPPLENLENALKHIQKFGTLHLEEIFEFVKILRYFSYLKKAILPESKALFRWIDSLKIPPNLLELSEIFDEKAELKEGIYPQLDSLKHALANIKTEINSAFARLKSSQKLAPYLVDSQIHLFNQNECLLLKAGFQHALSGSIIARSSAGFFYVLPQSVSELKAKQSALNDRVQMLTYEICTCLSARLNKHFLFLRFINKEFDKFDHLQARLNFARTYDLEFVYKLESSGVLTLSEFCHPMLKNPKPLNISFEKKITLITGVNAGGKTMLLKSLLSACLLAKYLLPCKINAHKSRLVAFKNISAIISDPQNSKNDISTFAGRMLKFSKILEQNHFLLGIDEIELGTDSDEAASLYKSLLEFLSTKDCRIILTTHHKRLSAIMAHRSDVGLIAALYDEKNSRPQFAFLQGSIGKSYAFETALRYGIPSNIIAQAKEFYGADRERLNDLIERSSTLELTLQAKIAEYDKKLTKLDSKLEMLKAQEQERESALKTQERALQKTYLNALNELKSVMKENDNKIIHKALNSAHRSLQDSKQKMTKDSHKIQNLHQKSEPLKVGDFVKFSNTRGQIYAVESKYLLLETEDGKRVKVQAKNLHKTSKPSQNIKLSLECNAMQKGTSPSLDLHGKRVEEAQEMMEEFLSNALIAGFDEVLIMHGIGSGKLSVAVVEFLKKHPKVLSFSDAPPNMGGFGAKLVRL